VVSSASPTADEDLVEHTMRLAGQTAANAPGFLAGFRIVGCVYIVGNAIGLLALTGWKWVFWTALAVNLTQAAGVIVIPREFFHASIDRYGTAGVLPSLLTLVLLAHLVRFRIRSGRGNIRLPRRAQPSPSSRSSSEG
jgi:hypothetical protein